MNKRWIDILMLITGSLLFAVAINVFVIPNDLGEGGVTGVTIILYYLLGWSPGLVNLIANVFLLAIGYRFLDRTTTIYTVVAVLFNSLFLHLTRHWTVETDDLMINAIFGGVLTGIGLGLIIRVGGTTAGSTILAKIMNKYLDWNTSYALLAIDLVVVLASVFIIKVQGLLFTVVMLYIGTKVMDFMIEGLNAQKAVMIVSNHHDLIADRVNTVMERGVTVFYGRGNYTNEPKNILYIVITRGELSTLKKIVKSVDKQAFLTIHDVRNVFGEGFVELSK
ncbi:YitT family protein [Paenibacillus sp. LHD-117]|uniref:YitT family protein n=1 Tax=Paenibacillus sp. LHD-117 TaxID=3071412 RepID=UPI0027DF958F|nr:YitT family protein [Paenibacillus sp. LHD-117]MDQ6418890.1 YitT family protein [Paenibacillus sp. LHD-117]